MLLLILYLKPGAVSYFSLEAIGQNFKFESPGAASHSSLEAFGQICHCWTFVGARWDPNYMVFQDGGYG